MDRRLFLRTAVAAGVTSALPLRAALAALAALTEVNADLAAVSGGGANITLEKAAVKELADSLRGNLLLPGNPGYDIARQVMNASIDRHPALIVQPTGVADIRHAVMFARERDLLLAVKCGGHSYAGKSTCEGGMQIDLSTYRHARVDPGSKIAYVAGGSLLGELDRESMALGLVTTAGTVSHTGVGGLTLGGGFGRLARRFGLALDNVRAFDIVTADGEFRRASAEQNSELYWALRGGGGNFGIVTSFEFELHPMQRQVVGGDIVFPLERARDILEFYADYGMSAPDDLYVDCYLSSTMTGEGSGAGLHVCYSGPAAKADEVLAPVRALGKPVFENIRAQDYVAIQRSWDRTDPRNEGQYLKGGFINDFPAELVSRLIDGFDSDSGRNTMVYFQHSGGAINRVAADATAFAHRKSQANMFTVSSWPIDADGSAHIAYTRDFWSSVEKFTDGWYTNEVSNEPQQVVNANYQGNYKRLLAVKREYDAGNLFRLNANIDPTG